MEIITVSQLNRYLKSVLEGDKNLSDLYVRGEISNFTRHYQSGHFYFSLRDDRSALRAVMFRSYAQDVPFTPQNGMAVLVRGNLGVFERDGVYQLYVTDMQPDGVGALALAFEQRKAKLAALGLFDQQFKKPLPPLPQRIGVVTSEGGAALQDIRNVLARRYPLCTLVLSPTPVQGKGAGASIARAVRALDGRCDVMIVGRGGGSAEDLWCWNDEEVVCAVFECVTPVISAVGHETDFTLCDFAADLRAPTPSAAAELAAPSADRLTQRLDVLRSGLTGRAERLLKEKAGRLAALAARPVLRSPLGMLAKNKERLDFFAQSLYNRKRIFIQGLESRAKAQAALLDSLSPLRVLDRGYSLVLRDGRAVPGARGLRRGDRLVLRFWDGQVRAQVTDVQEEESGEKEHDL